MPGESINKEGYCQIRVEVDIHQYPTRRFIHKYMRNGKGIFKAPAHDESEEDGEDNEKSEDYEEGDLEMEAPEESE